MSIIQCPKCRARFIYYPHESTAIPVWTRLEVYNLSDEALETECERWLKAGLEAVDPQMVRIVRGPSNGLARWYANKKFDPNLPWTRYNDWYFLYQEGLHQMDSFNKRYWQEMQLFGRPKTIPEELLRENDAREGSARPYGDHYMVPIFGETDDMEQRFRHEHGRLGIEGPSDPDEPWSDYSSMGGSSSDEVLDD